MRSVHPSRARAPRNETLFYRAVVSHLDEIAHERGLARDPRPDDMQAHVESLMFEPNYPSFVASWCFVKDETLGWAVRMVTR